MSAGTVQRHPEWRAIVDALSTREYGTQIAHAQIAELTGLRYPSARYFAQIRKARRRLLEDWERELESVPAIGYRLVLPNEFHGRSRRELRFAGRRLRYAGRILTAAPQRLLSDQENARNADALAKIGALKMHCRQVVRETRPALLPPPDVPKLLQA